MTEQIKVGDGSCQTSDTVTRTGVSRRFLMDFEVRSGWRWRGWYDSLGLEIWECRERM